MRRRNGIGGGSNGINGRHGVMAAWRRKQAACGGNNNGGGGNVCIKY